MGIEDAARHWVGLSLGTCDESAAIELRDVVVAEPALVLWLADGPEVRVARGGTEWTLRPRAGLFDHYPAGLYDLIRKAVGPTHVLKVAVPSVLLGALDAGERAPVADGEPRFQFSDRRLENLVRHLHAVHGRAASRRHDPVYVRFLMHATLSCWAERQHERRRPRLAEPTRRLVADYVERTLARPLGVDELARLTGYSQAQFVRRFRATFELPVHGYLLARRIERAKHLIRDTDLTLTAIAQQLGFASHAHFTTAFKRHSGTTPSEFRRALSQVADACVAA